MKYLLAKSFRYLILIAATSADVAIKEDSAVISRETSSVFVKVLKDTTLISTISFDGYHD